ncbi:MAG TPA: CpaF family protein [Actinobacteria bacterium]|nr:CpaF family protein [Actinomycetota bacterium]HDL49920.1 CpaF family protein [Actinomycetota bacterium]
MGSRLARRLGAAMDVRQRIMGRLLASDVPLERTAVTKAATAMLKDEAPLASPGTVLQIADALVGLGPLEALLRDPAVSDVLVNGPQDIWVERSGGLSRADVVFADDAEIVAAVERVIGPLGLRIDRASPMVDARLPDGSRLHAVVPPAAVDGPILAVRRFTAAVPDLDALISAGSIRREASELLQAAVGNRESIVISGGTGTGKTTLLNILSTEIAGSERIVTVEDAAELRLTGHVVRLEARPANAEGAGEVPLRELVRSALRLRPDRIILGEVRGPEALDMITAMNTGHRGSMSTVHANSPEEAMWRLETLALSGSRRVSEVTVRRQLFAAIDYVVQVERNAGGRRVAAIVEVTGEELHQVYAC